MENKNQNNDSKKVRFTLWIKPETREAVENYMEMDNCKKESEFIEKAILFYCGHLRNSCDDYLPNAVVSTLKKLIQESENRHSGSLFRIAVELSMIKNILAFTNKIGEAPLNKLRADCVSEVKKINGTLSFEEAIRWQT